METVCAFEHDGRKLRLGHEDGRYFVLVPVDVQEEITPGMAAIARSYLRGAGCMMVEEASRELMQMIPGFNWGRKRLFRWLREHGYCSIRRNTYNQPTQQAIEQGLMRLVWRQSEANNRQGFQRYLVPMITQKGLGFFADRLIAEMNNRNNHWGALL